MSKKAKKTAEVKEEVKDEIRVCLKCGAENALSSITCTTCHERMDGSRKAKLKAKKAAIQKTIKEKKVAEKKYSRKDAIADGILALGTFTKDELVSKAEALLEQGGGKGNARETKFWTEGFLPMLARLGVLTNGEGKEYHFIKPEEVKAE